MKKVARREELEIFQRALERLSPDHRLAIELRGLQHQSFNELARALHRSSDAARMIWARAMVCLRKEITRAKAIRPPCSQRTLFGQAGGLGNLSAAN